MIIDCISDLHGHYPRLDGGDLLIVAGDLTKTDSPIEYELVFNEWLARADYGKKIFIAGNHDNELVGCPPYSPSLFPAVCYLCDSGTEFEGLKIWGSPWTKTFPGMNPRCKAFTVDTEKQLAEKWALIPDDVDILVTHSPPYGTMDDIYRPNFSDFEHLGSGALAVTIMDRPTIKVHVFGHIHESYGKQDAQKEGHRIFVNASHVNEHYEPVNEPIRIEL